MGPNYTPGKKEDLYVKNIQRYSENVGSSLRISRSMLKVGHSFELRNLYNLRFIEPKICLCTKLNLSKKKRFKFVYSHNFVFYLLSTKSRVEHQSELRISL